MRIVVPCTKEGLKILKTIQEKIEVERKWSSKMTREKALEASRALDAIDGFEAFIDEIDKAVLVAEDFAELSPKFKVKLNNLLQAELLRLKQALEEM